MFLRVRTDCQRHVHKGCASWPTDDQGEQLLSTDRGCTATPVDAATNTEPAMDDEGSANAVLTVDRQGSRMAQVVDQPIEVLVEPGTETPLNVGRPPTVPCVAENIETVIASLMALPVAPVEEREDNYAEKIAISMSYLHEVNLRGKFREIKNRLSSHDRMEWFADFLVNCFVSNSSFKHGFYSRMMQDIGSDSLNSLVLSETYRAVRVLLKNNNPTDKRKLSNLSDWLGIITTTFKKCKPTDDDNIRLITQQVKAYTVNGQQYMYF